MPQLINDKPRRNPVSLLVLRLAVAGILGWAGYHRFAGEVQPAAGATPVVVPSDLPAESALTSATTPVPPIKTPEQPADAATTPAILNANGVKVDLGWDSLVGAGELGMAAALLFGLFTRLATFLGLGAVTGSALAANGNVGAPQWLDPLVQAYQQNPIAALLLGAIFLALLVGGSGPAACDSVLKRRRLSRAETRLQAE